MDPMTLMMIASAAMKGFKGAKSAGQQGSNPFSGFLKGALGQGMDNPQAFSGGQPQLHFPQLPRTTVPGYAPMRPALGALPRGYRTGVSPEDEVSNEWGSYA